MCVEGGGAGCEAGLGLMGLVLGLGVVKLMEAPRQAAVPVPFVSRRAMFQMMPMPAGGVQPGVLQAW